MSDLAPVVRLLGRCEAVRVVASSVRKRREILGGGIGMSRQLTARGDQDAGEKVGSARAPGCSPVLIQRGQNVCTVDLPWGVEVGGMMSVGSPSVGRRILKQITSRYRAAYPGADTS